MASFTSRTLLVALAVPALIAACRKSDYYCPGAPDDNCNHIDIDGPPQEQPPECTSSAQCTPPRPVCEATTTMTCVQCTPAEPAACVDRTPICGADHMCHPCTIDSDCVKSQVCDANAGSCLDENAVLYVSPNGPGNTCTHAQPCGQVTTALELVSPTRATIKMLPGSYTERVRIIDKAVTIRGEGADLAETAAGEILRVEGTSSVSLIGLRIHGGLGASGDGILCINAGPDNPTLSLQGVTVDTNGGIGLRSTQCSVTVTQSTISNDTGGGITSSGSLTLVRSTVSRNVAGGISVTGATSTFHITDNFITYNGRALAQPSDIGGAALTPNTGDSKFERNTVAFNESNGLTFRGGLSCNGPLVSAAGNLVYHNTEPDRLGGTKTDATTQTNAGGCQLGNTLAIAIDASNLGFASPIIMPFDFHLTAASPATVIDAAGACSGVDFDGDLRPAGGGCDLGADEYHP